MLEPRLWLTRRYRCLSQGVWSTVETEAWTNDSDWLAETEGLDQRLGLASWNRCLNQRLGFADDTDALNQRVWLTGWDWGLDQRVWLTDRNGCLNQRVWLTGRYRFLEPRNQTDSRKRILESRNRTHSLRLTLVPANQTGSQKLILDQRLWLTCSRYRCPNQWFRLTHRNRLRQRKSVEKPLLPIQQPMLTAIETKKLIWIPN